MAWKRPAGFTSDPLMRCIREQKKAKELPMAFLAGDQKTLVLMPSD